MRKFEQMDEGGEKVVVNLIIYRLNSSKDSSARGSNETEHVFLAKFSNSYPKEMKLEDEKTIEKGGSEKAQEAEITESNITQQIYTNKFLVWLQTEAAASGNNGKVELAERKKEEIKITELLQSKPVGLIKQRSVTGTEPIMNKQLSKAREIQNPLVFGDKAVQPRRKMTSVIRKFYRQISNCGRYLLKILCCQSQCCKRRK